MQRSIWVVFLALLLILLFGVGSAFCFYPDIGSSEVSEFESVLNSVMAPKSVLRGTKRLLKQCATERHETREAIEQRRPKSNRVSLGGDQCDQVKSDRWKTMCHAAQIPEASNECENVNGFEHSEELFRGDDQNITEVIPQEAAWTAMDYAEGHDSESEMQQMDNCDNITAVSEYGHHQVRSERWRELCRLRITNKNQISSTSECGNANATVNQNLLLRQNLHANNGGTTDALLDLNGNDHSQFLQTHDMRGECSHSFGQASYQRSKQGLIVKYEDSSDNTYTCDHCNASFWFGEALKRSSSNAPLIYTNCCKKGEIAIRQSKPTPTFLETLLNPNNGPESKLFRENIRVYNSMFSFTSMGATIDRKINIGTGPHVFKISGQVHHLMGSLLHSDGECPKYAQLYIYDTKNEVSNRINAIDPTHINNNIKADIVRGLIKMFDETNELVKEFRTMRDKFEDESLVSLNMTILNRQPTDSKQYEEPTTEEIGGLIVGDIGKHNSNKDIIIESNNGHLQRISKIHPKYMSLQYPILFPYGEDGYTLNLMFAQ
ncbi:uncharacterized protein LOC133716360 [Rosa rugosa]|uniref:uncharacterized protein LOC133716360 n=1 Tax=Rosa rugosa TaxID=74645 RepID=UPI002B415499|nr:uncharacterized protein LOC133716360 [Rosa rugosa]